MYEESREDGSGKDAQGTSASISQGRIASTSKANVQKRPATSHDAVSTKMKKAKMMLSMTNYNAISILNIARPELTFSIVDQEGPHHLPIFTCRAFVDEQTFEGKGSNKKKAKMDAAEKVVKFLFPDSTITAEGVSVTSNRSPGHKEADELTGTAPAESCIVKKAPEPTGPGSVKVLTFIRPSSEFFMISLDNFRHHFKMGVIVDGQCFEGIGTNRKLAKSNAAEAGLNKLFGLKFDHSTDGMAVFTGDPSCWTNLKRTNKKTEETSVMPKYEGLFADEEPLKLMNELYPTSLYSISKNTDTNGATIYIACITIENTTFEGRGINKKVARIYAACEALKFVKTNGLLRKRQAEKREKKALKPKWRKPERAAFLQNNGKPFGQRKIPDPQQKDAVTKLNDIFGCAVEYHDVLQMVSDKDGKAGLDFRVSVRVNGQLYIGNGTTRHHAQLEAAEAALRAMKMWTAEDENTKQWELDKSRLARMLYSGGREHKTMGVGQGFQRQQDWVSRGKSWVSGGILRPNPLILPELNSSKNYDINNAHYTWQNRGDSFGIKVMPTDYSASFDMHQSVNFQRPDTWRMHEFHSFDVKPLGRFQIRYRSIEADHQDRYDFGRGYGDGPYGTTYFNTWGRN